MESFLLLQTPNIKIPLFQISHVQRININLPIKGKKLYYLMIKLLSEDTTKSNIKDLDFSNSHNINSNTNERNIFKTVQSLSAVNRNNLEEIYTNILMMMEIIRKLIP